MTDWTVFDRLLASRRRAIIEGFVDFLRLNWVSQEPESVDGMRALVDRTVLGTAAPSRPGLNSGRHLSPDTAPFNTAGLFRIHRRVFAVTRLLCH